MIVERILVDALSAGLTGPPPVFNGIAPQADGNTPPPMPIVLVNRVASQWANCFGGLDQNLEVATLQIDVFARSNEASRDLADQARLIIAAIDPPPTLANEWTLYDEGARAWRVIQTWQADDYQPRLR